jgi:hypothetical protein
MFCNYYATKSSVQPMAAFSDLLQHGIRAVLKLSLNKAHIVPTCRPRLGAADMAPSGQFELNAFVGQGFSLADTEKPQP